jgi:hypothetical protein
MKTLTDNKEKKSKAMKKKFNIVKAMKRASREKQLAIMSLVGSPRSKAIEKRPNHKQNRQDFRQNNRNMSDY